MSCDNYYRHKIAMEIGTKKSSDKERVSFKDDHELLAYLLEQEKRVELTRDVSRDLKRSV